MVFGKLQKLSDTTRVGVWTDLWRSILTAKSSSRLPDLSPRTALCIFVASVQWVIQMRPSTLSESFSSTTCCTRLCTRKERCGCVTNKAQTLSPPHTWPSLLKVGVIVKLSVLERRLGPNSFSLLARWDYPRAQSKPESDSVLLKVIKVKSVWQCGAEPVRLSPKVANVLRIKPFDSNMDFPLVTF